MIFKRVEINSALANPSLVNVQRIAIPRESAVRRLFDASGIRQIFLLVFKFRMKLKTASVSSRMAGITLVMVLRIFAMPFPVSLTKPPLILFVIIGIGRVRRRLILSVGGRLKVRRILMYRAIVRGRRELKSHGLFVA
jgi:hypothetical protein